MSSLSPLRKNGPLFTKAYNRFLRDPSIKAIDKIVFLALKNHRDSDEQCIPPIGMIADELHLDRKTIYASITRLEAHGLLSRTPRTRAGNQVSNQYFFHDLHYVKHVAKTVKMGVEKTGHLRCPKKRDTRKIKKKNDADSSVVREEPSIIPFPKLA